MSGAIPPLPQYAFTAWCLVEHRDTFTFYLTLEEYVGKVWIGLIWLWMGPVAGCCEHGNESSRSIKGGNFLN